MRRFIVTLLHTDGSLSNVIVDTSASEWFVLQSQLAHKSNVQSYSIIDAKRLRFYG
jgi:hypothetical protein